MKKIITSIGVLMFMIALTQNANAQIEKGKTIIGATSNLGFNSNSVGGISSSTFLINTSTGKLFTEKLAGGVDFGFASVSYSGNSSTAINVGGFGRFYVNNFFPEISLGIINSSNGGSSSTNFYYGFGIGYAIPLNDYISIDPRINYTSIKYETSSSKGFGINVGFSLYF